MQGSETKTLSFFQLQRCRPIAYLGLTARPRTLNITFLKLYVHGAHRPQWDHRVDPGIRRKETKSLGVPPTLINIKSLRRLPNRTRDLSSSLRCDPCGSSESEQLQMHDHSGYNEIYRCPHLKTPKFFKIQDPCSPSRDNRRFQATTNLFKSSAFHRSIQFETKVNRLYNV